MGRVSRWLVPTALLCVAAAGCGADTADPDGAADVNELAGRAFVVTELEDPRRELVPGSTIRLEFTGDSVAVQAGCNNIGGAYEVEDGMLVVDQLGGTEMGCDQPLMAQDAWVTAFLSAGPAVRLAQTELELATEETTVRLSEKLVESVALEGTVWRLDSLVGGTGQDSTVSTVPGGAGDGRLLIEGALLTLTYGCTTITAPVEVTDARLEVGETSVAVRDCAPRLPELERRAERVLSTPTAYVVTGSNLMLSSADGTTGLGFVAE